MPDAASGSEPRRVTMKEVAEAAGVSIATASRALSGQPSVAPDLVLSVRRESARLGYRTNAVARALRTQSTGTVGMVIPQISNPFFPSIVEVIENELHQRGRSLILSDSQGSPSTEALRIMSLLEHQVDGLLVVPCDYVASAETLNRAADQVPVVQLDRFAAGARADFVGVDNDAGIVELIEHLRSRGARTMAYVGGEPNSSPAAERTAVFQRCVGVFAPECVDDVILGANSTEAGRAAAKQLLSRESLPDAVVCGADVIALGMLAELGSAGVVVPRDVLVTGFDDIEFASMVTPSLTTIHQPSAEIAREAVMMLERRLQKPFDAPPRRTIIRPTMIRRASA